MLIAARWLLTGIAPPVRDGAVLIEGDTIRDVGTRRWFAKKDVADVIDLGESILVPGFVNAHAHLEHSALKGKIPPKTPFSAWARAVQKEASALSAEEKTSGIVQAIDELIRGGTTTLVDHRGPETGPIETPFRQSVIWEVLGAGEEQARASARAARERMEETDPDLHAAISPHSLYAVHPKVLEELPVNSLHLLESEEEERFFRHGTGPLADLVRERGGALPPAIQDPVSWLADHGHLNESLMIVHGNYLTHDEIRHLRGSGATVIHCPESAAFFGHRRLPIQSFFYNGIRIAIGTDSLASADSLNMLKQMQRMKKTYPTLGEEDLLRMATFNGAKALGLASDVGIVEPGKKADLVGIPLTDTTIDPYEALLLPDEVNFSMVGGKIIYRV